MFDRHNLRRTRKASIYLDKLLWKPKSFGRFPDNPAFSPTLNFWTEREGNPSGTWKMHFWGNKRKLGERKWTPNLWNGGKKSLKVETLVGRPGISVDLDHDIYSHLNFHPATGIFLGRSMQVHCSCHSEHPCLQRCFIVFQIQCFVWKGV